MSTFTELFLTVRTTPTEDHTQYYIYSGMAYLLGVFIDEVGELIFCSRQDKLAQLELLAVPAKLPQHALLVGAVVRSLSVWVCELFSLVLGQNPLFLQHSARN